MDMKITEIRNRILAKILEKQDGHFRWAFDEQVVREHPELTYYCSTFAMQGLKSSKRSYQEPHPGLK